MSVSDQINHSSSENNNSEIDTFRTLTQDERNILHNNGNFIQSPDSILIHNSFNPALIFNCRFFGKNIIGAMKEGFSQVQNITLPLGLYNSTFFDCTIGHFTAINNLAYCSNSIIGNQVVIHNVGEISNNHYARFGNGSISGTNPSENYLWIQLINENGARQVLPFEGMLCTDAYIWSKYRNDDVLLNRLKEITNKTVCNLLHCKGTINDNATILNSKCIRNSMIGFSALIDNSDSIINCTIQSDDLEKTSIGSSVIIKDAIIGFGCSIQSGAQLHSVVTGNCVSVSQVSRISNSFIGDNSAIACCEIAHSLILPSHGQHHNNSFLIASMIGGQSNIAAGATVGSNHNSRMNDGEIWANRGFWPGLCTSFKHNSKFASFTMCAKGDYPFEIDNPFPFSLISSDSAKDRLVFFPAFWFTHNMYAFMRNRLKFNKRDKRIHRKQIIEHDPLAPDTIEEIFAALDILERCTGEYILKNNVNSNVSENQIIDEGRRILLQSEHPEIELYSHRFEKGKRPVLLKNISQAWHMYRNMIYWYSVKQFISYKESILHFKPNTTLDTTDSWINCGGQIWSQKELSSLFDKIKYDKSICTWSDIHHLYNEYHTRYDHYKFQHAIKCLIRLSGVPAEHFDKIQLSQSFKTAQTVCNVISENTFKSREKDFSDHFRSFIYDTEEEMTAVLGNFSDDPTIIEVTEEQNRLVEQIQELIDSLSTL